MPAISTSAPKLAIFEAGKLEVTQGAGTHLFGGMQRERADCGRLGGFKATL